MVETKKVISKEILAERTVRNWDRTEAGSSLNKSQTKKVIDGLLNEIEKALLNKEEVRLIGLGTLKIEWMNERKGVNLQTKKPTTIPARYSPKFKFSTEFKKNVKEIKKGK